MRVMILRKVVVIASIGGGLLQAHFSRFTRVGTQSRGSPVTQALLPSPSPSSIPPCLGRISRVRGYKRFSSSVVCKEEREGCGGQGRSKNLGYAGFGGGEFVLFGEVSAQS